MADVFDKSKRSDIMKRVHAKGNKTTELKLISLFNSYGIRGWRRGYPVVGHPDFVFLDRRIAVFVDGCFWHGHDCRNTRPKDNEEYWSDKRRRNIEHDNQINNRFQERGWTVIRVWECELKKKNEDLLLEKLSPLLPEITREG